MSVIITKEVPARCLDCGTFTSDYPNDIADQDECVKYDEDGVVYDADGFLVRESQDHAWETLPVGTTVDDL